MLSNLQTDDSRKWNLKMRTGFDWHGVTFHHTVCISSNEFCHFHPSDSLLHPSGWGSEGAATQLGWLPGLNHKRTFLTVPGQRCPRAAALPGCDLLWQFSRCNPHLQQKRNESCLSTGCLIFENWIQKIATIPEKKKDRHYIKSYAQSLQLSEDKNFYLLEVLQQ